MRGEIWVRESNSRKPNNAHVGIGVFENPLREEDQAHGKTDQDNT
jgi:hypothetical protein